MLTVGGPAAARFITLLGRHSGLQLRQNGQTVEVDARLPGNPYCSPTLQTLVQNIITGAHVRVTARGDVPGGIVDSFFGIPEHHVRSRTVFVRDLETLERLASELAAAFMAHFLAEYFHAAARGTPRQFADAHVAGLVAEAQVIRDLTGRPIFTNGRRPWDRAVPLGGGRLVAERRYGPGNVYLVTLGPPPGFSILRVSRSR
jgi:hypothetical protein